MSYDVIEPVENITIYSVFYNLIELVKTHYSTLNFAYGYWNNVSNEMVTNGRSSKLTEFDKYPLVFVHADFKENKDTDLDIFAEIDPKVYILARTKPEYRFMDRYTNVFVAMLYPIYVSILTHMKSSDYFKLDSTKNSVYPLIPHVKKDLYFIGSLDKNQNVLNEYVDAIELSFSKLQINNHLKF
jgi:hypothetical protein